MQLDRVQIRRLTRPVHNIPLSYLQKLLGCFWVISICTMKRRSINFALLTESEQRVYLYYTLQTSSSLNTVTRVTGSTLMHHTAPCFTDDAVCFDHQLFQAVSMLLSSRHSAAGGLYFSRTKKGFSRIKSNLVLWWRLWWSLLLIVDTSVSWRVFFSWLDVVKERGSSDHHLCVYSGEVLSWL